MIIKDFPATPSNFRVDLYNGGERVLICTCDTNLQDFTITREGDNSKFFGYGICQKLSLNLIELDKSLVFDTVHVLPYDASSYTASIYPWFYVTEINRNEDENITTITAYDALYDLANHTVAELNLTPPYSLYDVVMAITNLIGISRDYIGFPIPTTFIMSNGANFNGDETLRQIADAVAEATQSIYYISNTGYNEGWLTFKRLDRDGESVLTISRDTYFDFTTKTNRRLSTIRSTSDLDETGLEATTGETGTTQYVRSNPFWDNRTDLDTLLKDAIAAIGGLTINQFHCEWEGNCLLEIGDKISIELEDGSLATTYLLDDTITYDGFFNEISEWEYSDSPSETLSNPTSIGEKINETYARVDKVNKRVDIVISDVAENTSTITKIQADLEGIDLKIENSIDSALEEYVPSTVEGLDDLKQTVETNTEKIAGIEIDLDSVETRVSSSETKITTLETDTGDLESRVTTNESNIATLRVDLNGIDATIESKIDTALEEYVPNVEGLDDLKQTVATHTEKISGIEIDIDGIKSDVSENTTSITTLQDDTGNLKDRVTITESNISSLEQTTENISASVATTKIELREEFNEDLGEMENQITTLSNEVSLKMTSEDVTIAINKSLENGVDKVTTTENKFTFNDSGLTISKSDSDISTTITEDGMTISRNSSEVLVADNQGVKAEDLHATTYLIIGDNSRFEDQGNRTACFWLST